MIKKFKKTIASLMVANLLMPSVMSVVLAFGASSASAMDCSSATVSNVDCLVTQVGTSTVKAAKVVWHTVSEVDQPTYHSTLARFSHSLLKLRGNNTAYATSGTTNSKNFVDTTILDASSQAPSIIAEYNAMDGKMTITAFKTEVTKGRAKIMATKLGPGHGGLWEQARSYGTGRLSSLDKGLNPFAQYGNNPYVFENVRQESMGTPVGHAMRLLGAPVALIVKYDPDVVTNQSKHGGHLRKKITTTRTGYMVPSYYVATPAWGSINSLSAGGVCMVNGAGACPTNSIAPGLVSLEKLDSFEDRLYTVNESKGSPIYTHSETRKQWTAFASLLFAGAFWFVLGPSLLAGAPTFGPTVALSTSELVLYEGTRLVAAMAHQDWISKPVSEGVTMQLGVHGTNFADATIQIAQSNLTGSVPAEIEAVPVIEDAHWAGTVQAISTKMMEARDAVEAAGTAKGAAIAVSVGLSSSARDTINDKSCSLKGDISASPACSLASAGTMSYSSAKVTSIPNLPGAVIPNNRLIWKDLDPPTYNPAPVFGVPPLPPTPGG